MRLTLTNLLFILISIAIYSCGKCKDGGHLHLQSRSWLPVKGKSKLTFVDSANNVSTFRFRGVDTTGTGRSRCGGTFLIDYITATLYLDSPAQDSIYFSLSTGSWLCLRAMSNNNFNMGYCNIFDKSSGDTLVKRLSNFRLGNKSYSDVLLIVHNPGNDDTIDSIFLANNTGIVGFKYYGKHYVLQ